VKIGNVEFQEGECVSEDGRIFELVQGYFRFLSGDRIEIGADGPPFVVCDLIFARLEMSNGAHGESKEWKRN
jgi:hypothetical protein